MSLYEHCSFTVKCNSITKNATYCVIAYRDPNGTLIKIALCGETIRQEFLSAEEFKEWAHIDGRKIKDIWDEVNAPRYM